MAKANVIKRKWNSFKRWLGGGSAILLTVGRFRRIELVLWTIAVGVWFDFISSLF